MIQDVDKTLEKIIFERGQLNKSDIGIAFEQPNGEWSASLNRPTLNCWCYDLRENLHLRNMEFRVNPVDAKKKKISLPPARYDLSYLVTAWARDVADEHQLLWRALTALAQIPILDPADCVGGLRNQEFEIPMLVGNAPERAPNLTDLWSVLDNEMRLGFTVVLTVALDRVPQRLEPMVFGAQLEMGVSEDPRGGRMDTSNGSVQTAPKPNQRRPEP